MFRRTLRWILSTTSAAGCIPETATPLARDLLVDSAPTAVPFAVPLPAPEGARALCFEFERPGDSGEAGSFTVVLTAVDGVQDTVRGRVDRVGESSVCLRDSVPVARIYRGVTLVATRPVRVRHVEWRAPKGAP